MYLLAEYRRYTCCVLLSEHQEDDTLLGVTWCDMAQLGAFGRIRNLGKYINVPNSFAKCPQSVCQVSTKHSNYKLDNHFS